jgi:hypothetical protein
LSLVRRVFRVGGRADGRWLIVLALVIYFGAVWHWTRTQGWVPAWHHVRVASLAPDFNDARAVLGSYDRFRAGATMDQLHSAPKGVTRVTYPHTWLVFSYLGLGEASTYPVALTLAAACFGFSLLYMGRISVGQAMLYLALLLSPSLMLGVERGNADLLMFLMVLAACWLFARQAVIGACALLLGAGLLKVYPVAAMAPALRHKKGELTIFACAALFLIFCYTQMQDLAWVSQSTPRDSGLSFGEFVVPDRWHLSHLVGVVASLTVAAAALAAARRARAWTLPDDFIGSGFVAGSSILVLCFLIGNNYAYRYWFALLLFPQLIRWVMSAEPQARWAVWMLAGLVLTTWATSTAPLWLMGVTLDWLLFGGVVYGLMSVLLPSAFRQSSSLSP